VHNGCCLWSFSVLRGSVASKHPEILCGHNRCWTGSISAACIVPHPCPIVACAAPSGTDHIPHRYAWSLLQNLLSEVLTQDEWLILWDNVFSSHPGYLLHVTVAYLSCVGRGVIVSCVRKCIPTGCESSAVLPWKLWSARVLMEAFCLQPT